MTIGGEKAMRGGGLGVWVVVKLIVVLLHHSSGMMELVIHVVVEVVDGLHAIERMRGLFEVHL